MRRNDWCRCLGFLARGLLALCVLVLPSVAQEVRPEQQKQEKTQTCPDCKGPLDAVGWCEKCKQGSAKGLTTKCRSCFVAIQRDGWCDDCDVGYVAGTKTSCKGCFAAKVSPQGAWCDDCKVGYAKGVKTKCKSCLAALQKDGWCDDCEIGYAGGQKTACKSCFAAMTASEGGWCEDCKVGYGRGVKTKCKSCFASLQKDGWCDDCDVGYVAGKKTSCKGCFALMSAAAGGWCDDCKVGHFKGLKTTCKTCFAAMQSNGSCEDCGVRFQDGRSFRKVALHVHWDDEQLGAVEKMRKILSARKDVSGLTIDGKTGDVRFELETTKGAPLADVVAELAGNGFEAHREDGK